MSEEAIKRMKNFINNTITPNKPSDYALGYEEGIRTCYNFVNYFFKENEHLKEQIQILVDDNAQLEDMRIEAIELIKNDYFEDGSGNNIEKVLEILGDTNE